MDRAQEGRQLGASDEAKAAVRETRLVGTGIEPTQVLAPPPVRRRLDQMRARLRREDREGEVVHAASSRGERYAKASATCSLSTVSDWASAAIVRAVRATRARPRPESGSRSTALESNVSAADVRRAAGRSRAAAIRAATAA